MKKKVFIIILLLTFLILRSEKTNASESKWQAFKNGKCKVETHNYPAPYEQMVFNCSCKRRQKYIQKEPTDQRDLETICTEYCKKKNDEYNSHTEERKIYDIADYLECQCSEQPYYNTSYLIKPNDPRDLKTICNEYCQNKNKKYTAHRGRITRCY